MSSSKRRSAWTKGPPPAIRGSRWWVIFGTTPPIVQPIELSGAVINPEGSLLIKTLHGVAHRFEGNEHKILFHAPMNPPAMPPEVSRG